MPGLACAMMALTALTLRAQTNISYYCGDNTFYQVFTSGGAAISHGIDDSEAPTVRMRDWILGDVEVPVEKIDSCIVRHMEIPVVRLTLPDYPEADMPWSKEEYADAILSIDGNGLTEDAEGLEVKVRGRGNTSWSMPKKPMRLKFSKKTSIYGFPAMKNYVLLANYIDPSLMRNAVAMWLAKRLDVPFANTMRPCHVFINDHYAGAYTMTEKVGINSTSVDIDEETGILLELSTEFDEPYKFESAMGALPVMVKDPDFDELYEDNPDSLTPQQRLAKWEADFNRAEAMAMAGDGAKAFDIESAVNYLLLYDIVRNTENRHPKSLYIHKRSLRAPDKYCFGPAWDFDYAFNKSTQSLEGGHIPDAPEWGMVKVPLIEAIMATPEFRTRYNERLAYFRDEVLPDLLDFIDEYSSMIGPSAELNGRRWPEKRPWSTWGYILPSTGHARHAAELREWLINRAAYLTRNL